MLIRLALAVLGVFMSVLPAQAADLAEGAKLFGTNCAACHAGGLNRVAAAKTLRLDALEKYGMNSVEAITYQIIKGKNAMPALGKKLNAEQIENITYYVLDQAEHGWN